MKKKKLLLMLLALLSIIIPLPGAVVGNDVLAESSLLKTTVSGNALSENSTLQEISQNTGYRDIVPYWRFGNLLKEQLGRSGEPPLPACYDSRAHGYVTKVKDQKSYGTCWAFATMAAAESSIIKGGLAKEDLDLSEYHLVYFSYSPNEDPLGNINEDIYIPKETVEGKLNYGGNPIEAMEQMAKWSGPIKEETLSYEDALHLVEPDSDLAFQSLYHIKNVFYADSTDREMVKKLVYRYGAATAGYYSDPLYYENYEDTSTYHLPNITSANHSVCIVGWDDNFSKENFKCMPLSDGAWLCKNSNYVNDGYVWISYDTNIGAVAAMEFDGGNSFTNNYQYDGCIDGTRSFCSTNLAETLEVSSFMNVFAPKDSQEFLEKLEAVSIHVNGNANYYITVYVNPVMNEKGQITDYGYKCAPVVYEGDEFAGIRTVNMEEPIYLNEGDCFAVEVSGADIKNYAVSVSTVNGYESMKTGECYAGVTEDGVTVYKDLAQEIYQITPRIKAFTTPTTIPCATNLVMNTQKIELVPGENFWLQASSVVPEGGLLGVTYYSSNSAIASVAANGEITAHGTGECVITAQCTYGNVSKQCKVQVKDRLAESLSIQPYVGLRQGEIYTLTPILDAKATNRRLEYVSENHQVATVNEKGQIYAVHPGETTIVVKTTDGSGLWATCEVKVESKTITTEKIYVTVFEPAITVGGFTTLTISRYPSMVDDDRVEYTVSNPTIVSVENGIVKGLAEGSALITVKALDSGVTDSMTITVYANEQESDQNETKESFSQVGKIFKYGNLKYKITSKNKVTVIGGTKKNCKSLTIPGTVKYKNMTYFVTEVSDKAFYNFKKLTTLRIGAKVKKIGKSAFYGCKALKNVTIESSQLAKAGRKAFGKTSENMIIKAPKQKLAKYKKLFKNAGLGKNVKWKKK